MSGEINTGHDMWQDHKDHYGVITARIMCLRYLEMQAKRKDPEEREFCRELREAMDMEPCYRDKEYYRHSWETAQKNGEEERYNDSDLANGWCAGEIDDAIKACEYGDGSYKLAPAAQALLEHYGAERLSFVLAIEVRRNADSFSADTRNWAQGFDIQSGFTNIGICSRTEVIDDLITNVREAIGRAHVVDFSAPGQQVYTSGTEFWCDLTQTSVDLDAAFFVGGKHIEAMMNRACSETEMRVCRELFTAMHEAAADVANPYKVIYPHGFQHANERMETKVYNESRRLNTLCARAIDTAIHDSRYAPHLYNFDLAAMKVIHEYGFERVNMVLAKNLQALPDSRPNNKNMKWAAEFTVPEDSFSGAVITSHRTFLEYFATSTRKLNELTGENSIKRTLPEKKQELAPEIPSELNESEKNFAAWLSVTESSRFKWVEDEIYRLNGRGAMYYTGGEDGVYMRISKDGKLEAGNYEGAFPHIGEAMFSPVVTKQFDSFNEAYKTAVDAGGKQFLVDMFSGSVPQPLHKTGRGAPDEKPSVLKQIRDAQSSPKPQGKDNIPEKRKNKTEPDL